MAGNGGERERRRERKEKQKGEGDQREPVKTRRRPDSWRTNQLAENDESQHPSRTTASVGRWPPVDAQVRSRRSLRKKKLGSQQKNLYSSSIQVFYHFLFFLTKIMDAVSMDWARHELTNQTAAVRWLRPWNWRCVSWKCSSFFRVFIDFFLSANGFRPVRNESEFWNSMEEFWKMELVHFRGCKGINFSTPSLFIREICF